MLSVWTGLRISDVATFDVKKRLRGNGVFLRMHKTKKELYTWIPDWLVERSHARAERCGPMVFEAGQSTKLRIVAESWRRHMGRVFELAGWSTTEVPDRFPRVAKLETSFGSHSETHGMNLLAVPERNATRED